jgi:hypothetical protein
LGEEVGDQLLLVASFDAAVLACGVVGLVPQVPAQNPVIVAELGHHRRDVVMHDGDVLWITEAFGARALRPTRVVHAGPRRALASRARLRIPTGVEEYEQRFDAMARRDVDELPKACLEAAMIGCPELIMKEHPCGVVTVELGPAQLGIDAPRVEGVGLEHLELVDGVRWNVVCSNEPALRLVPTIGALG